MGFGAVGEDGEREEEDGAEEPKGYGINEKDCEVLQRRKEWKAGGASLGRRE